MFIMFSFPFSNVLLFSLPICYFFSQHFRQTFIVFLFNWCWWFMFSVPCEWRLTLLDGFRAEQSQSGLVCPRSWVLGLCMLYRIFL